MSSIRHLFRANPLYIPLTGIVETEHEENEEKAITPTRRDRFNFIADVVAETGSTLVYIEGLFLYLFSSVKTIVEF